MKHSSSAKDIEARLIAQGERGLLPASWKSMPPRQHIELCEDDVPEFLRKDLLTTRITDVKKYLWMVGRKIPPRPLHVQILVGREIVVAEQIELHLVWTRGKIFIKPLPRYLKDPDFRATYLTDKADSKVAQCARGLIHSYTALIQFESDLLIAREKGLIPAELEWPEWRDFVQRFIRKTGSPQELYQSIDERYHYGELRLSRLNKIYIIRNILSNGLIYGYSNETAYNRYGDFFRDNLDSIAAILAYIVIVLTAMQVGLATTALEGQRAFQNACYGFSVFSIIAPLIVFICVFLAIIFLFFANLIRTLNYKKRRNSVMGLQKNSKA